MDCAPSVRIALCSTSAESVGGVACLIFTVYAWLNVHHVRKMLTSAQTRSMRQRWTWARPQGPARSSVSYPPRAMCDCARGCLRTRRGGRETVRCLSSASTDEVGVGCEGPSPRPLLNVGASDRCSVQHRTGPPSAVRTSTVRSVCCSPGVHPVCVGFVKRNLAASCSSTRASSRRFSAASSCLVPCIDRRAAGRRLRDIHTRKTVASHGLFQSVLSVLPRGWHCSTGVDSNPALIHAFLTPLWQGIAHWLRCVHA